MNRNERGKDRASYLALNQQHLPRRRRPDIRAAQHPGHARRDPKIRSRQRRDGERGDDVVDRGLRAAVQRARRVRPCRRIGEFKDDASLAWAGSLGGDEAELTACDERGGELLGGCVR